MTGLLVVTIRPARAADAGARARHRYPGETGAHLGEYRAWLPGALEGGQYLGWLAEQEGDVIGGAGLLLTPWQPSRHDPSPLRGRVVNVFVEPEFRRQGLARRLVEAVLEGARAQGLRTLSLGASEPGRPLYASLGFLPVTSEMLRTEPDNG